MTITHSDIGAAAAGLGFDLGEELSMVRDSARDFADSVLAPLATKHDREESISDDVYKQLGTEVARQLAETLGIKLMRFDMSEYMERHTVSRLIGAPPGYVGFDQGGLLTDAVDQTPHAVLLLDEIEKAHPDLFNILLQVMDHGKLTDNNGKIVDFRNVILIMTTNAGAQELSKSAIGFNRTHNEGADIEAIEKMFTPEFRNRLDAIIPFAPLGKDVIRLVVDKFIMQLDAQLADRNVEIELSEAAMNWLAERGYDAKYGARPLARVVQEHIKKPLADETKCTVAFWTDVLSLQSSSIACS